MTRLGGSPFQPSQLFVSHVNGSPSFVRKCRKSWLVQGSSGRRLTLLPGTTFLHINGALQPYNIRVAHKTYHCFMATTDDRKGQKRNEPQKGTVYKMKCCDCQAPYVGERGRNVSIRLTEHKRAARNGDINNHITEHHLQTLPSAVTPVRTLESWCINVLKQTPLNRC